jgi:hypothetical protein
MRKSLHFVPGRVLAATATSEVPMTVPQSLAGWQQRASSLRYDTGHFIDGRQVQAHALS